MAGCPDQAWWSLRHLAAVALWVLMHINEIVVWGYPDNTLRDLKIAEATLVFTSDTHCMQKNETNQLPGSDLVVWRVGVHCPHCMICVPDRSDTVCSQCRPSAFVHMPGMLSGGTAEWRDPCKFPCRPDSAESHCAVNRTNSAVLTYLIFLSLLWHSVYLHWSILLKIRKTLVCYDLKINWSNILQQITSDVFLRKWSLLYLKQCKIHIYV